jgi:hypothetical protein
MTTARWVHGARGGTMDAIWIAHGDRSCPRLCTRRGSGVWESAWRGSAEARALAPPVDHQPPRKQRIAQPNSTGLFAGGRGCEKEVGWRTSLDKIASVVAVAAPHGPLGAAMCKHHGLMRACWGWLRARGGSQRADRWRLPPHAASLHAHEEGAAAWETDGLPLPTADESFHATC